MAAADAAATGVVAVERKLLEHTLALQPENAAARERLGRLGKSPRPPERNGGGCGGGGAGSGGGDAAGTAARSKWEERLKASKSDRFS